MKNHAEKGDAEKNLFWREILLAWARFGTPRGGPLAKKGDIGKIENRPGRVPGGEEAQNVKTRCLQYFLGEKLFF